MAIFRQKSLLILSHSLILISFLRVAGGVGPPATGGVSSFRADAGFEVEQDVLTGLSSSVRCSKSKLSYSRSEALYSWEVDGWLSYLRYLKDYGTKEFNHNTGTIKFDSDSINGEWNFELRSNGTDSFVTATYTYTETSENENGNIGIKLNIFQPNFESIQLPIQKPTETLRERAVVKKGGKKSSSSSFIFSYQSSEEMEDEPQDASSTVSLKFNWPSIPSARFLEFQNENLELTFAFMIQAYFLKDPKILKKSTCALDHHESQYLENVIEQRCRTGCATRTLKVPFMENMEAMFHDTKFTDYVIRVEDLDIPAHGIILQSSGPKFAQLVAHPVGTDGRGRKVVSVDGRIGYNGTKEIIRYLYTGAVRNLENHAKDILVGADALDIPELKAICEKYLAAHTNLGNVVDHYALAISVNSSRLVRKAFAVIQTNRASLVAHSEDFRKLSTKYPNLMFELFIS